MDTRYTREYYEDVELQSLINEASDAEELFTLDELESHADKMRRFQRQDDSTADENSIINMAEE